MISYEDAIKVTGDYKPDKAQKEFYDRTSNFLQSNQHILVNPAGMGLGKTLATVFSMNHNILPRQFCYFACPTSPLKSVWSRELSLYNLRNNHMVWFSKADCCIKKRLNPSFDLKKCNDDCPYWNPLQKDGKNTDEMFNELSKIKKMFPFYPNEYYQKHGQNKCLLPTTREGLRNEQYLVGDYFGFLNPTMFNLVINNRDTPNKMMKDGILVVDEAHLVPQRAKDYLSSTLNYTKIVEKIDEEIMIEEITSNPKLYGQWFATMKTLNKISTELVRLNKKEARFCYKDFVELYTRCKEENAFTFLEFLYELSKLEAYVQESNSIYEEGEEPYSKKLKEFIMKWDDTSNDENYKHRFQYINYNRETIRFIIDCCDTSNFLKHIFSNWNKVILNSGTIPDLEFFKYQLGLEDLDTKYAEHIESYSIKENVLIYPFGDFTGKNREDTYEAQAEQLNQVISKLKKRTIIYIQAKYNSRKLVSLLKTDKKVIDFCSRDDGYEIKKSEFERLINEFNCQEEAIAIMNINGRVEGFNFESVVDKSSVKNVIIYGYPFARRGLGYDDMLEYYTDLMKDKKIAQKWIDFSPILSKIHQAVCRAKRKKEDNPVIILWDKTFGFTAYKYMPNDMKGEILDNHNALMRYIDEINKRDDTNEKYTLATQTLSIQ